MVDEGGTVSNKVRRNLNEENVKATKDKPIVSQLCQAEYSTRKNTTSIII